MNNTSFTIQNPIGNVVRLSEHVSRPPATNKYIKQYTRHNIRAYHLTSLASSNVSLSCLQFVTKSRKHYESAINTIHMSSY